jgi:hypothetical protein
MSGDAAWNGEAAGAVRSWGTGHGTVGSHTAYFCGNLGTAFHFWRFDYMEAIIGGAQSMRTPHALAFAVAVVGSALLSLPANAQRVCDRNCVGPFCNEQCVERDRDVDVTVGRGRRDRDVIIEERRRYREPGVEIRRSRPGVEIEVGR